MAVAAIDFVPVSVDTVTVNMYGELHNVSIEQYNDDFTIYEVPDGDDVALVNIGPRELFPCADNGYSCMCSSEAETCRHMFIARAAADSQAAYIYSLKRRNNAGEYLNEKEYADLQRALRQEVA